MNSLTIQRQDGNVPASLAGLDHVSGIIFYLSQDAIPQTFRTNPVAAVSTIDKAEELGISLEGTGIPFGIRVVHYQLTEIFRMNKGISLYVGLFPKPQDAFDYAEVKTMQNFAEGRIRQLAIWSGDTVLTETNLASMQSVAEALDAAAAPLSILYAPKVENHASLPTGIATSYDRVSVVIAQAGIDPQGEGTPETGAALYASAQNAGHASVSCIGLCLGMLSRAAVHQSISWVKNFPSGISLPAMGDGVLVRNIDKAVLEGLDTNRYLFLTPIVGIAGSYWNDSHNMTSAISDYNAIERVRTMDKAVRGIRTYLTPELGGNVYIDPDSGQMQQYTVEHLETVANKALEDMEKAGELSGYQAKIDPKQDVLSTSTVEVVIKNVPVGVVRRMRVKIGYVKSLS